MDKEKKCAVFYNSQYILAIGNGFFCIISTYQNQTLNECTGIKHFIFKLYLIMFLATVHSSCVNLHYRHNQKSNAIVGKMD